MSKPLERFAVRGRIALNLAEIETRYLGQRIIETPHVLLGLVDEKDGTAGQILSELGLTHDYLIEQLKAQ